GIGRLRGVGYRSGFGHPGAVGRASAPAALRRVVMESDPRLELRGRSCRRVRACCNNSGNAIGACFAGGGAFGIDRTGVEFPSTREVRYAYLSPHLEVSEK